jgi:hypothetical protein
MSVFYDDIDGNVDLVTGKSTGNLKEFIENASGNVGTVKNITILGKMDLNKVAAGYGTTNGIELKTALSMYLAQGLAMELAVRESGTYNPCYMSFVGAFKPNKLSSGDIQKIIGANANSYHTLAGRSVMENGRCTGTYVKGAEISETNMGEWVDTVIFIDLMRARLQEAIFGVLISASDAKSKIPYTQGGIDLLHFAASTRLDAWVASGQLQSWTCDHVRASDVPEEDRSHRRYHGFRYTCKLAGAINTVKINVNLED